MVIPSINNSLAQLSTTCANLSIAISSQQTILVEAKLSLNELDAVLVNSRNAVSQTDGLMTGLEDDLNQVSSDVLALGESSVISDLVRNGTLNADSISEFMGSPTELNTVEFYHPNAYGTSMVPLFMNLTCWIGAFMLMIIMRLVVDTEGVPGITFAQRYLSRFIFFSGIVVAQAVICCIGMLFLGVKAVNVPAMFIAGAIASLAYLSLIYFLSTTLQHIGKGLCIVLVFAQIPGATGLYPVELTSKFFQDVSPFMPFTYGINGMREAIGGFYGYHFFNDMIVLILIFIVCLILGVLLQPAMSNVNRMVAAQVRESDLFNGENVDTPIRSYWIAEALKVLSEREDYRRDITNRYRRFNRRYPAFIRAAIVVGVGTALFAVVFAVTAAEKVTLLTLVLLLLVALSVFLVVVETMRYNFKRQMRFNDAAIGNDPTNDAADDSTDDAINDATEEAGQADIVQTGSEAPNA